MDLEITYESIRKFKENGFAIIPGFLSPNEVEKLKEATNRVIQKYCVDAKVSIFSAKQTHSRDKYFAESGDKIRGFFEEQAIDDSGNVVIADVKQALNKVGHALHKFDEDFKAITFGSKVRQVEQKYCHMKKPTIFQSMVIFKQPNIGDIVLPHQDASFLYTEPPEGNIIGFWIALDEATTENGCLQFLPGSHKEEKLYTRFIRNPDKNSDQLFIFRGDKVPDPPKDKLISAPAKPGDLVLIDGLVIHQSEPNTSTKPRLAYTFHIIEGDVEYSPENWLQPTAKNTFMEFPQE